MQPHQNNISLKVCCSEVTAIIQNREYYADGQKNSCLTRGCNKLQCIFCSEGHAVTAKQGMNLELASLSMHAASYTLKYTENKQQEEIVLKQEQK